MRIKSLEIQGFKSFVDPLKLDFQGTITAVVGPNGCGKSNISDAIRWVLGEQSYKQLRGRKMEDIIFNGTSKRKAIGLASVSFTLIDSEGDANKNGFSEICISRRLYRSGESQYLINKVPCRLKDIIDLFIARGGNNAMTVFEQNQIAALVSSKPEEKRFLIEEAADIVPLKYRKLAALKKLEHTEQNLLRLGDIVEEVKNQYSMMQRQAKKLESYRKYQEEIKELELALLSRQVHSLAGDFQVIMGHYSEMERSINSLQQTGDSLEKDLEERQSEKEEREEILTRLQQEAFSLQAQINKLEERHRAKEYQVKTMGEEVEQITEEIAELKPRLCSTDENTRRLEKEIRSCDSQLKIEEVDILQHEEKIKQLRNELSSANALLGQIKGDMVDFLREIASQKNTIISLKTKIEDADQRRDRLDKQLLEENDSLAEMGKNLDNLQLRFQNLNSLTDLHQENRTYQTEKLKHLTTQVNLQKERVEKQEQEISGESARLNALMEMERGFEGYSNAVKNLLGQEDQDTPLTPPSPPEGGEAQVRGSKREFICHQDKKGLLGLLTGKIEVQKGFEIAIEAALGDKMQALVTSDLNTALTAIEWLKNKKSGKATFVMAPAKLKATPEAPIKSEHWTYPLSGKGILGRASDFVHCQEEYRPIVDRLLGQLLIVENIQTALSVGQFHGWEDHLKTDCGMCNEVGASSRARSGECGVQSAESESLVLDNHEREVRTPFTNMTMVTLAGDLVEPWGSLQGGGLDDKEGHLLKRKNEIATLQKRLEVLTSSLKEEKGKYRDLLDEKSQCLEEIKRLETEITKGEIEKTALEKDLLYIEKDSNKSQEKIALFQFEASQIDLQKNQMIEDLEKQKIGLDELLRQQKEMDSRLSQAEEEASRFERQLEEAKEHLSSTKISLTAIRARKDTALLEMAGISRLKGELEERIGRLEEKSARNREGVGILMETGEKVLLEIASYQERFNGQHEKILVERQNLGFISEEIKKKQKELEVIRHKRADLDERLKEIIPQKTELEVKLRYLEEQAKAEYQLNLEDLVELSGQVGEMDLSLAQASLSEIKGKKARLGEVNAEAIDEFKKIAERHDFLQQQYDDLLTSLQHLKRLIEKLDAAIEERFGRTFQEVNTQFQTVFRRLFGGGEAALVLSQEEDLLETGVDIMAHPPGKRMQNLLLLSAGEKALTALALLFSVFLIKPSPFCLLDEVDATLDEANISRFCQLVEELSEKTQFIIITHNKKTMAIAKVLYGVTMEEEGVSKVISLSLKDTSNSKGEQSNGRVG